MTNHSTSHHGHGHVHDFDEERARRYDKMARQTLPGYEELHNMASSLLGVALGDAGRVLVVGAGTGMELLTLAGQHAQWRLTGVDPSIGCMFHLRFPRVGLTRYSYMSGKRMSFRKRTATMQPCVFW